MKLLIVNNLASGFRDGAIYDFMRAFASDGDEICVRCTDGNTDLADFLRDAENFDAVVAAGGDGTVASVAYLLAETGIPLLPFPAGTANLLAMNLASPAEPHALAHLMREQRLMDFDIGEIELSNGERFGFSMIAGAGYDAAIMEGAEPSKRLLGPMAYFTAAFANFAPQFSRITLTIDGKTVETQGVGVLAINFSKLQFDISLVHENLPRDGMFDIVVMNTHDAVGPHPGDLKLHARPRRRVPRAPRCDGGLPLPGMHRRRRPAAGCAIRRRGDGDDHALHRAHAARGGALRRERGVPEALRRGERFAA